MRFAPPSWALRLAEAGQGILFLDEISNAPPAVQSALLRVILERVVGDLKLPDGITIIAAANPPDVATDGWNLKPPLANRMAHIQFTLNPQEWTEQFPAYWGEPPQVGDLQEEVWLRARSLVAGFIRSRPHLLLRVPQTEEEAGRAWPSPRSWDYASRLLAQVTQQGEPPVSALPYVVEVIGEGTGTEFIHWVENMDLPDPETLLAHPERLQLPSEGDKQYAILSSVVAAVISRDGEKRWQSAWKVLARAAEAGVDDIAGAVALQLARLQKPRYMPPPEIRAFVPLLRKANLLKE